MPADVVDPPRVPIDRGFAWVILSGCLLVQILLGLGYLSGLFYLPLVDTFGASPVLVSWCLSMQSGLMSVAGLFSSLLCDLIGLRLTFVIGASLQIVSYVMTAFARSFSMVFVSYGLLLGTGIGMCYIPSLLTLEGYFVKYRNTAYGIVTPGVGIGLIIFPPMTSFLIDMYGWRGAMLIIGGIMTHYYIVAIIMVPVDPEIFKDYVKTLEDDDAFEDTTNTNTKQPDKRIPDIQDGFVLDAFPRKSRPSINTSNGIIAGFSLEPVLEETEMKTESGTRTDPDGNFTAAEIDTGVALGHRTKLAVCETHRMPEEAESYPNENPEDTVAPLVSTAFHGKDVKRRVSYISMNSCTSNRMSISSQGGRKSSYLSQLSFRDGVSRKSVSSLYDGGALWARSLSSFRSRRSITDSISVFNMLNSSPSDLDETGDDAPSSKRFATIRRLKVLLHPAVIALNLVFLFISMGHTSYYIYMPTFAQKHGSTPLQAAQLLSVVGVLNILSRFMTGTMTNGMPHMNEVVFLASTGLTALVFFGIPLLAQSFSGQVVMAALFSLYSNCFVPLMIPLAIDVVGLQDSGLVFGAEALFSGVGALIGPLLAGLLYEDSGNIELVFYFAGKTRGAMLQAGLTL